MADGTLDDLAAAARLGERHMDRLLDELRPIVARWALVLTGSPDTAEDVAQAVLLRVHRSIADYSPSGSLLAWVYRITRNVVTDMNRKNQRDHARLDSLSREGVAAWLSERSDALELLAATDQLRRFMTALSPQQRAVLDLVELQGFSPQEVGEMLEISPETVRVHLHRAKAAMTVAGHRSEDRRDHG
jgi:RNA polymerase sigma factor (sigma-70 family)